MHLPSEHEAQLAGQPGSVHAVAPAGDVWLPVHCVHVVALMLVEYVLTGHCVQVRSAEDVPLVLIFAPFAQFVQSWHCVFDCAVALADWNCVPEHEVTDWQALPSVVSE